MAYFLNEKYINLDEVASKYCPEYLSNGPFPNIIFDDFFDPEYLEAILKEFPDLSKVNSISYNNANELKFAGKGEQYFGEETKKFMQFLNSEPFLYFLQQLTGIKELLIGDPYYVGGGQHEIKKGGLLKIHADFNKHRIFKLDRRVNVLIYLNKDWKTTYGGHFELWNRDMTICVKKILPLFNRMVIFSTDDFSYHGHPNALECPESMSRKSLALYYYSYGRPLEEINVGLEEHSTLFKYRKGIDIETPDPSNSFGSNFKTLAKEFLPPILIKLGNKIMKH